MHFIFTTEAHEVITKINEKNKTNMLRRGVSIVLIKKPAKPAIL